MDYYIHKNDNRMGPFPEEQVREMLANGAVAATDSCWREGLATWIPLSEEMGIQTNIQPPPIPHGHEIKPYAGFWLRFAASLIDSLVLIIPSVILGAIIGVSMATSGYGHAAGHAGNLLGIILGWLYAACMESSTYQATLGKLAMGIRVTDENGYRISFARASGRHFGKIISALTIFIGYMMAGWTERKQALHDMMASCLVIRK